MTDSLLKLTMLDGSLQDRLSKIHDRILETVPQVDRIGCAIYDAKDDLLKTFINSTRKGVAIANYEYRLSDSQALSKMVESGDVRVIDNIRGSIEPINKHSSWLLEQGYQSSLTVPMFDQGALIGFVFYDSCELKAFGTTVQRDLVLFSNLINMMLSSELSKISSISASVKVAREFANIRDFETGAHLERMARFSRLIAIAVAGHSDLSDEFIECVYLFAPLHDIGKIGIPDNILLKQGKLNDDEYAIMQTHVEKGVELVDRILKNFDLAKLPDSAILRNIVSCHHEFLDGSGYPKQLRGDQVPIEARIITVADILDALTSTRPYKKAWTFDSALEELRIMARDGKLDGNCVDAVAHQSAAIQDIIQNYQDT